VGKNYLGATAAGQLGKFAKGPNVSSALGAAEKNARSAERIAGGGLQLGKSLTDKQAIERLRRGMDIYASSRSVAKQLQKKAGGGAMQDGPHRGGFPHFHEGPDREMGHSFFGEQ